MDFGGFDSGITLISSGGIYRPIGDFPESLSQAMLVGTILVGGLGVHITRSILTCVTVTLLLIII